MKGAISVRKKVFLSILSIIMCLLFVTQPVFAETNVDNTAKMDATAKATIKDPDTGEEWIIEIPQSSITTQSYPSLARDGSTNHLVQVDVSLGEMLRATGISSTKHDDIRITAGLYYNLSADGWGVSITSAFGSTEGVGLYYPSNRRFYWGNPGAGVGSNGALKPTTNSWSYTTNSTYGQYYSSLPPWAITDCTVLVSGMTGVSREVSVTCELA